jgi:hypothetical protein
VNVASIFDGLTSHAMSLGLFETVNQHEPKAPPATGVSVSIWLDSITPVRSSGLDSVSVAVVFNIRLYTSAESSPLDSVDPDLLSAVDTLCAAYVGDFTLDGAVRNVDIFSTATDSQGLSARFGYLAVADNFYRMATIVLPVVVNDVWTEVA